MTDSDLPPELVNLVDIAAQRVNAAVIKGLRDYAELSEQLAPLMEFEHDEACADAMRFAATRVRRIADRFAVEKGLT